jgi:hypothetical protein
MQQLSRRQFFIGMSALAASKFFSCKTSSRKRIGTFKESVKVIEDWLKKNNFKISKKQFTRFIQNISFELDVDISSLVQKLITENKNVLLKKGRYVFYVDPLFKLAVSGKLKKQSKIKNFDICVFEKIDGEPEGYMGRYLRGKNTIFLYEDRLKGDAFYLVEKTVGMLKQRFPPLRDVLDKHKQKIKQVLHGNSLQDFMQLSQHLAAETGITTDVIPKALIVLKLNLKDREMHNHFTTAKDNKLALEQSRYNTIVHELTHAILDSEDEILPILAELAYGNRQHPKLASFMLMHMLNDETQCLSNTSATILQGMQNMGLDGNSLAAGVSEDDIKHYARSLLHNICLSKYNKPFEQLVDVSIFSEVRKLAANID